MTDDRPSTHPRTTRMSDWLKETVGSLRFQLTFWNTLVVLVWVVGTLVALRAAVWLALLHEMDLTLLDDLAEMKIRVEEHYPDLERIQHDLEQTASTHSHRKLYFKLLDAAGQFVWQSSATPPESVLKREPRRELGPETRGEYRLLQRLGSRGASRGMILQVGASVEPLELEVHKLTNTMAFVGTAILIITPLGGYWLARRATQPVNQIIETTRRLHPARLEERLPIRGTNDELDRLSRTINGFLDRIHAYLERNRQFTANAAHELRSPLAAIQSTLDVLLEGDRSREEYKEALADTLEECASLRDLINQLLILAENDVTRGVPGAIVPWHEIVAHSCDMFQAVAESKGIRLNVGPLDPCPVRGDASRLRQVINNLIDNALKYTLGGGSVRVELHALPDEGFSRLGVSDTGIGIAAEDRPLVFERFYRVDRVRQRHQATGGTGLGLSICQSIVEAHGGRIELDSELGRGTTFTVWLPWTTDAQTSHEPTVEQLEARQEVS